MSKPWIDENKKGKMQEIIKLREQGLTFAQIGSLMRVSRQRIHQMINRDANLTRDEWLERQRNGYIVKK